MTLLGVNRSFLACRPANFGGNAFKKDNVVSVVVGFSVYTHRLASCFSGLLTSRINDTQQNSCTSVTVIIRSIGFLKSIQVTFQLLGSKRISLFIMNVAQELTSYEGGRCEAFANWEDLTLKSWIFCSCVCSSGRFCLHL